MQKGKKIVFIYFVAIFCIAIVLPAFATDAKKPEAPVARLSRPNFVILSGTVSKIDNADPGNVKLDIKSDKDNSIHTLSVMPWTNITKVTDIGELKQGEAVRVITRKVDNKDAAMGIVFGKIKTVMPPEPMAPKLTVEGAAKKEAPAQAQGSVKK